MTERQLIFSDLGFIDYKECWELQKHFHVMRAENQVTDHYFLLEHPNTYTLGRIADQGNLLGGKDFLEKNNISVYEIDRGGDITYHGPGQIVGYPIISLTDWVQDTHKYLRALEEVIIRTCADYGLKGERDNEFTGVWVNDKKIAAIGIKVSRWITMHGFAFNINTDLALFNGIIPCGISHKSVTSLKNEIGKEFDLNEVKEKLLHHFTEVFEYKKVNIVNKDEIINYELSTQ